MFKEKHYGEIWLPENEEPKYFCILEFKNNEVYLETNLLRHPAQYKIELLYGKFTGLGACTFINNKVRYSESGLIEARIYQAEYTVVSPHHYIYPSELGFKEFKIDNKAINDWLRHIHLYDYQNDKLEKQPNFEHTIDINDRNLQLKITRTTAYESNSNFLRLNNLSYVSFGSQRLLSLIEAIDVYNVFQKFLLFYYGKSFQFKSFQFRCLGCDTWGTIFYKDDYSYEEDYGNFIKLDYSYFSHDLSKILNEWFTNYNIEFCADIIIDNVLAKRTSHNRRFTNSILAFEAYNNRFGVTHQKSTLERYFLDHKDILLQIVTNDEEAVRLFIKKIIRSRDFFIHGNSKQADCFPKFELLYISFLIDFVVGIGLSKKLNLPQSSIDKIIDEAKSIFHGMQNVNKILKDNILK